MLAIIAEWIVWGKYVIIDFFEFLECFDLECFEEASLEFWEAIHHPPCSV